VYPSNGAPTSQEVQTNAAHRAKLVQPPLSRRCFSNNAAPIVQHGVANKNATSYHQSIPNNAAPTVQQVAAQEVQPDVAQQSKPLQPQVGK